MKKSTKSPPVQLPHDRKSSCSIFGSLTALAAGLALLGGQSKAFAQADNFNDGNDTANPAWTHQDPLADPSLGGIPHLTYSFPGGNTYRMQAAGRDTPNIGLPAAVGPARGGSTLSADLSSFYISVDVVGWTTTLNSAFGILARIATPGLGATVGYSFTYQTDDHDVQISRITGENPSEVTGTLKSITLDPLKQYRMVFQGVGTNFEGRIYDLTDLTTPLIVVYGTDATYSHGVSGLLVYDNGNGLDGADATYDNFFSDASAPSTFYADDFNDGNDTAPAPAWAHYDPLNGITAPPASFTFPSGHYRIVSPAQLDPGCGAGPARAGSIRSEIYGSFYVSVDLIDWDDTVRQVFGVIARANTVGLGTTEGYLFSYELGGGTLPNTTGGDLDMSPLAGEAPLGQIETNSSGVHLTKGKQYRMTFSGAGNYFIGRIFDLADPLVPIKTVLGTDTKTPVPYTSGKVGLVVASQGSCTVGGDATFDNFFVDVAEPRLLFDGSSGSAVISWPGNLTGLWVLESSPTLGTGAVWTGVPLTDVVFSPETLQNTYTATTPMNSTGDTLYRLRRL